MSNTTVHDVSYPDKLQNAKKNTQSLMSAQPAVMEGFTGCTRQRWLPAHSTRKPKS